MKPKLIIFRIACCVLLCVTTLAYILICEAIHPWMLSRLGIFSVLLPVLIAEAEISSLIGYFMFSLQKSKVQTFLKCTQFICATGILLLSLTGLFVLLLESPYMVEIALYFGLAVFLLGISKLVYSIWKIVKYRRNTQERKVSKVLLLTGKMIFSLIVIRMGWWGMLIGSFISI